jgi:hypothetical protein
LSRVRVSITYTALIWLGMALCVIGVSIVILGLGESSTFELTFGGATLKSTQSGLMILIVGAILSGIVASRLPEGVIVLDKNSQYSETEKFFRELPKISLAIIGISAILFIISYIL